MKFEKLSEKDIKSKQVLKMGYKSKEAWLDDSENGKSFFAEAILGSDTEVKSQGKLASGVEFVELKVYFKIKEA